MFLYLGPMEVHMLPLAIHLLPHSGLSTGRSNANSRFIGFLGNTYIGDDSDITQYSYMWRANGSGYPRVRRLFLKIKVVLMKLHTLNQVSLCFRLKRGEICNAKILVGCPIACNDRIKQSTGNFDNLFSAHGLFVFCVPFVPVSDLCRYPCGGRRSSLRPSFFQSPVRPTIVPI